jgi:thiamine-monophosphate kinase
LDISDGLIADVTHLATASRVAVLIELERLPLSPAARAWLADQPDPAGALEALASGGDDYEIAFTVGSSAQAAVARARKGCGSALTVVGRVAAGEGVRVTFQGVDRPSPRTGWRHS